MESILTRITYENNSFIVPAIAIVLMEVWEEIKVAIKSVSATDDWLQNNPPILKVDKTLGRDEHHFIWQSDEVPVDHAVHCCANVNSYKVVRQNAHVLSL